KSGLWLYRNASSLSTAAVCLNEGAVVRLNYYDVNYYTVWYNGVQYYVPKTSLVVPEDQVNTSAIYAVELIAPAELFTNNTLTTKTSPIITLSSGSVINVRIARKNTSGTIAAYSYEHSDGKTYYINANTVDPTKLLGATVASNLDTNLITSITVSANVWAYSSPKITSSSIEITAGTTVYGVSYDAAWYKIIHNDSVWYLRRDADPAAVVSQIAIAGNAASATCTVVIGIEGAKLYDKPQTNAARQTVGGIVYEPGMLNYIGTSLQPGAIVQAYQYDSGWYSIAHGGVTRYFQLGKTSNSSLNDSIQSYRITIPGPGPYNNILYSTISDLSNPLTTVSLPAGTFAMRKINQVWSQVVLNNVTYYIKNVDLATLFATEYEEATPIASTTVGKSYRITIGPNGNGDPAKIYTNDLLTGTLLATNVAGYQTMGLKLHVAGAVNNDKMVYRITYSGQTAYVSAEFIVGILEGDEVEEARLRAEQEQNTDSTIPIGQTNLYVFTANTQLYRAMSTGGTPLLLPAQTTLQATKVNADWYSVTYNGETYYIRSSVIEPGGTTAGGTVQVVMDVGDTYTHTFTHGVFAYSTMSTSGQEIFIPEGSVYQLYKINEDWYEITYQGEKAYIQVKEINLPRVPVGGSATLVTTPPTTTTPDAGLTDGTGYITSLLIINPTSGTVNLRRTASLSATILDRIPKGTQVVNNGYTHDASGQIWYSVTYNGRTGYVRGDLVAPVGGGSGGGGSGSLDPAGDMGKSFLVNTASVNVRQGPGTTYAIIGQMAKNATVVPISYEFGSDGFAWYRFQFSGSKYGYIRSDYLAGSAANTVQQSGNVAIRLGGTNMRSGPGDTFNVIAQLNRDIIVTILGTSTDSKNVLWYRITVDGKSGYVRADLVRPLTTAEQGGLQNDIVSQYIELKSGSKGPEVVALQQQLINLGFLAAGNADGTYGPKTVEAVRAFQASKGLSANGVASPGMQAMLFNTTNIQPGTTTTLDWFAIGNSLLGANKNIQIFDIQAQITWNATFIHGENHADVVPASKTDADKLKANNITGSYVRRPVIVTIGGQKYAGSMYAVGHGSTSYVNYFSGVMCIHFTGSRTHGSNNVDPDHQKAIQDALNYANTN
ncbi:MAG: SH3 domain-containing protein, partial [Clostridia bacterium]|nr:SH3 domain-containing protein [Clostridia bacterium]